MGKKNNFEPTTVYARLRENYNQTHTDKISEEKLAKKLHSNKTKISRIENGDAEPSIDELKAYSNFFGVSVDYLLGIEKDEDLMSSTALRALGLSDKAVETLKLIVDHSNEEMKLIALVNAFLSGKEKTLLSLQGMFVLLRSNYQNKILNALLHSDIENYITNIVLPQMRVAFSNAQKADDMIASISNAKQQEE